MSSSLLLFIEHDQTTALANLLRYRPIGELLQSNGEFFFFFGPFTLFLYDMEIGRHSLLSLLSFSPVRTCVLKEVLAYSLFSISLSLCIFFVRSAPKFWSNGGARFLFFGLIVSTCASRLPILKRRKTRMRGRYLREPLHSSRPHAATNALSGKRA